MANQSSMTETEPAAAGMEAPEESAGRLSGRALTPGELAEVDWYDDLSLALRQMRQSAGWTQAQLAERLQVRQSEISRFENAVGPRTQLGKIRAYVDACGGDLSLILETGRPGRSLSRPGSDDDPKGGDLSISSVEWEIVESES